MAAEYYKNFNLENLQEYFDGTSRVEEWRPINGWDGKYEISSFGRVKSLIGVKGHKIIRSFSSYKYRRVGMGPQGGQIKYQVHRLVAAAFHPNPENMPEVNHKKGIRWDNRAWELEWTTSSKNKIHAFEILGKKANSPWLGKFGEDNPKSNKVFCPELNRTFYGLSEAAMFVGVTKSMIYRVCKGLSKTAKGMSFKYIV